MKRTQKNNSRNEVITRQGSPERSPPDPRNPSKIMENDDFLTEYETFPNRSPVVQGHSGDAHGPGNARYDALRPPCWTINGLRGRAAAMSGRSEDGMPVTKDEF